MIAAMPCILKPIPDTSDFEGPANQQITIVTKDHIGSVLIAKAEYAGAQLVPAGTAVSQLSFNIAPTAKTLKLVCVFTASTSGVGELREDAPPDSQFLISLNGDEPFQAFKLVGK
jgi:hypothetical protein